MADVAVSMAAADPGGRPSAVHGADAVGERPSRRCRGAAGALTFFLPLSRKLRLIRDITISQGACGSTAVLFRPVPVGRSGILFGGPSRRSIDERTNDRAQQHARSKQLGNERVVDRRTLLKAGAAAAVLYAVPTKLALANTGRRSVTLLETHRHEILDAEYWIDGWYNPDVLAEINWLMRDWRTDEHRPMDPGLLDILHVLQRELGRGEPIHIISGYRSPSTNAMLVARNRGVARNSYHIRGQAADIRLPSASLRSLRNLAMDLQAGGVGYYPRSNFVHVDTGPVRDW